MSRIPQQLDTERLLLRVPEAADVEGLNAAIAESFAELTPWMPWAREPQTLEQTRAFCERARREWRDDVA